MDIYKKYLNESSSKFQEGDYIMQDLGGEYYYGLLLKPQKKGGFKAIICGDP